MIEISFLFSCLQVANYPYDARNPTTGKSRSPDDAIFKQVSLAYSHAHRTMSNGRPCPKISNEVFKVSSFCI